MSGGRRRTWLVVRREWRQRVRSRAFRIATAVTVLIVVAIVVSPQLIGGAKPTRVVGLVGESSPTLPGLLEAAGSQSDLTIRTRTFPDLSSGRAALRSGEVAVLLVDQRALVWKSDPDSKLSTVVVASMQDVDRQQAVAALGLTPDQVRSLLHPPTLTSTSLEPPGKERASRAVLATIGLVLLFVAISTYGGLLLVGIVEEKSNRVIEVLLSRLRPTELLVGKIAGIGLVGLAQFGILAIAALAALAIVGNTHLPATTPGTIAWIVFWFGLGYSFYSVIYGAAGSLASRLEDAQAMQLPIVAILLTGYLLSLVALGFPDSTAVVMGSLVPFTAPMVMIVRVANGGIPWWQIVLAVGLMVATIIVMVRLASRVYSGAVLQIGGRIRLREAWRAGRVQN